MTHPKVFVLYAPGINCHQETMAAFELAGGRPRLCHLTGDLLQGRLHLTDCDILAIPGGFAFGDHIAAGRIAAIDLIARLCDQLQAVREKGILVLGICNGFQVLVNTGLLPGTSEVGEPNALLDRNRSAVFESRWIRMRAEKSRCVWTENLVNDIFHVPVAHGEGRLRLPDDFSEDQTVFRYVGPGRDVPYPCNPNGSPENRAGICDPSGRILGLMPHPERALYPWFRSEDGLHLFKAGIDAVR
ncbi:MAG TPA: phosphoribosylformylglycinamidine synthase I [bacterium]|nr:phosphoribosylformylglycinamidine synthase I [bacterium]